MNLLGTVVSINLETEVKGTKGMYPAYEIIYRNADNEIKTLAKHLNGLKYNKPLANGLAELAAGDKFTIEQDKNEGGYWEPKIAYKGWKEASSAPASSSAAKATGGGGNWPTAAQREETQKQIVRQSSLGHAVNLLALGGSKKLLPADVILVAQEFEAFVHGVPYDDGSLEAIPNDDIEVN